MNLRKSAVVCLVLTFGACADEPGATGSALEIQAARVQQRAQQQAGSGLVLESLRGLSLPLIGQIGTVVIDHTVLTELILVEDVVGKIISVEAEGLLKLTGGVLGSTVVTEDFRTVVQIANSGRGTCRVLTVDLGEIELDVLGRSAFVDAPVSEIKTRGAGAVGTLLCGPGRALQGVVSGVTDGVRGLVDALNTLSPDPDEL
jgi:hypothetical protein